jgi:hypothetical protein
MSEENTTVDESKESLSAVFLPDVLVGFHKRFPEDDTIHNTIPEFDVNYSDIDLLDKLAAGAYGVVFKGLVKGRTFAIKLLDLVPALEEQVNIYIEITLLKAIPHERLVNYIGASHIGDRRSPHDGKVSTKF